MRAETPTLLLLQGNAVYAPEKEALVWKIKVRWQSMCRRGVALLAALSCQLRCSRMGPLATEAHRFFARFCPLQNFPGGRELLLRCKFGLPSGGEGVRLLAL